MFAVVTTRDWFAMASSQVEGGHVQTLDDAHVNIRRAYATILSGLADQEVPFVVSSYESLVSEPGHRRRLLRFLLLPDADMDVYDGNGKWYASEIPNRS